MADAAACCSDRADNENMRVDGWAVIRSNIRMEPVRVYDYLTEARRRVFDLIRPLDEAGYRREHPVGLGSIARTLHHMRGAEWSYMERIRGRTDPIGAVGAELDPEVSTGEALAFEELESAWIAQAERVRGDLLAVTDWATPCVYSTVWEGRPYAYRATRGDIFAQVALHEVHHRTQVLQMLRRLGVETIEIDYNALMWEPVEIDCGGDGGRA